MRPTDAVTLLEVRVGGEKGAQTVFPGSVHETGEEIHWDETGEPTEIADNDLLSQARLLASVCLFARYWLGKARAMTRLCSLEVSWPGPGCPLRGSNIWSRPSRKRPAIRASGSERAAEDAAQAFHAGKPAAGFRCCSKTFSEIVAKQVAEWLEYRGSTGDDTATGVSSESDVERLNRVHAVLPIGGKTRVVTFGELEEFPGRETIVMTQTIADFKSLQNKYRHTYRDKKGELQSRAPGHLLDRQPEAPAVRRRHGIHAAARRGRRQSD